VYSASSSPHRVEGEVCFMRHYTPSRHKSDDKEETETEAKTRRGMSHKDQNTKKGSTERRFGSVVVGFGIRQGKKHQTLIPLRLQRSKMEKQLDVFKGEIDVLKGEIATLTEKIELKESQLMAAAEADKADIRTSIKNLNDDKKVLLAHRRELSVAAAAADARGKYPPLAADANSPPLYPNTPNPPLVVAPLSSETPLFKPSFKSRFKPCVELEAVCSYGMCLSVVRGGPCCTLVWRVRSVRCAVAAPLVVRARMSNRSRCHLPPRFSFSIQPSRDKLGFSSC
jgi:hypothetical protein